MRLIEFADPKPYILSADDAADFLKQLERIWPHEAVAFGTRNQEAAASRAIETLRRAMNACRSRVRWVVISAMLIGESFTIAQGRLRLRSLIPPNLLLTIWRTIAHACAQSSSLGSSGVTIVTMACPELGVVMPIGNRQVCAEQCGAYLGGDFVE